MDTATVTADRVLNGILPTAAVLVAIAAIAEYSIEDVAKLIYGLAEVQALVITVLLLLAFWLGALTNVLGGLVASAVLASLRSIHLEAWVRGDKRDDAYKRNVVRVLQEGSPALVRGLEYQHALLRVFANSAINVWIVCLALVAHQLIVDNSWSRAIGSVGVTFALSGMFFLAFLRQRRLTIRDWNLAGEELAKLR